MPVNGRVDRLSGGDFRRLKSVSISEDVFEGIRIPARVDQLTGNAVSCLPVTDSRVIDGTRLLLDSRRAKAAGGHSEGQQGIYLHAKICNANASLQSGRCIQTFTRSRISIRRLTFGSGGCTPMRSGRTLGSAAATWQTEPRPEWWPSIFCESATSAALKRPSPLLKAIEV